MTLLKPVFAVIYCTYSHQYLCIYLIYRIYSALFAKRSLFVQVQKMLESYSFKLDMRRHVVSLFSEPAKLKGGGLVTWMGSC